MEREILFGGRDGRCIFIGFVYIRSDLRAYIVFVEIGSSRFVLGFGCLVFVNFVRFLRVRF